MSLAIGEIKTERCSAEGSPKELWNARVQLSKGAEGLRHAYGPTREVAEQKLMAAIDVVAEVPFDGAQDGEVSE